MKQKDIAIIVVVGVVAGVLSLLATQAIFVKKDAKQLTAQKVEPISAEFKQPDKSVFNDKAVNPTQLIQIGDGTNSAPF